MDLNKAFDEYQRSVDADPAQVCLARDRRDVFKTALGGEPDVVEVFGSGSLRRSTQLKPVHDVDLVVVYDAGEHPEWGRSGDSSDEALEHARSRVKYLLGTDGTADQLVRLARPRNRAVKCFIDPPEQDNAFTVDVMPALRNEDGTLLLPSRVERQWSSAHPEFLIGEVAARQSEWDEFRRMVRLLKLWRLGVPTKVKSLVMEVLALRCLPVDTNRPEALQRFFTAAVVEVGYGVVDPAGLCGPIQPGLETGVLRTHLERARDLAVQACSAAEDGNTDGAARLWQRLLGADFPAPEPPSKKPGFAAPLLISPRPVKDAPQG